MACSSALFVQSGLSEDEFRKEEKLKEMLEENYLIKLNNEIEDKNGYSIAMIRRADYDEGKIEAMYIDYYKVPSDEYPELSSAAAVGELYESTLIP